MTPPEFSRTERLDAIGSAERSVAIAADAAERAALAERFGLIAIDRLEATFALRSEVGGVRAVGRVSAAATQACSVTGEPIAVTIDEPVGLRFVPPPGDGVEDFELTDDACDTVFHDGSAIDLGEAAAETLALALDPFPRGPNAAAALRAAGVLSEDEARPLGALAGLRDMLRQKS